MRTIPTFRCSARCRCVASPLPPDVVYYDHSAGAALIFQKRGQNIMNGCEKTTRTMGQTIRRLRMEQNLTQETLAELLGVTSQAVSKWENGVSHSKSNTMVTL